MQFTWKILNIGEIQTVGKNNLEKRTVVLEEHTEKEYKGGIAFDLIKDKTSLIDKFKIWDVVDVSLNFKASEYNGRYFTNISAWKIELVTEGVGNHAFPETEDMPR